MRLGLAGALALTMAGPLAAEEPISFDLHGVRIGDEPRTVETALAEAGYARSEIQSGPDFEQSVALRRGELEQAEATASVAQATYERGEEVVVVTYLPWPSGPGVTRVRYLPDATAPGDCPGLRSAYETRYAEGIAYQNGFIDRPLEKDGFFENLPLDAVMAEFACGVFETPSIELSQVLATNMLNEMLTQAHGSKAHDF